MITLRYSLLFLDFYICQDIIYLLCVLYLLVYFAPLFLPFSNNIFVLMLRLFIMQLKGHCWTAVCKKEVPVMGKAVVICLLCVFLTRTLLLCCYRVTLLPTNMATQCVFR